MAMALTPGRVEDRCLAAKTGCRLHCQCIYRRLEEVQTHSGIDPEAFDSVLDIIVAEASDYRYRRQSPIA